MNSKFRLTMAATAVAVVAACGGGGGGGESAPALKLSGTAATGLALAGGAVDVKCATGTGTATTDANGNYTISITGGALPCMIQVNGTTGGVSVTLHSVADAGTASGTDTTAVANVTPLTEMIVAQLAGTQPDALFSSFGSGTTFTSAQVQAATAAIVSVLRDVVGIDLGTIDPFKAPLVAATSTTSTGNTYDQLLDALGDKVSIEALPLVVTQIATTAAAGSSSTTSLTDVMTAVDAGTMPGCPTALSGRYRLVDYFGRTYVRQLDFKNATFNAGDNSLTASLTMDSAKPCQFVAAGKNSSNQDVEWTVVMGTQGAAAYRVRNLTTSGEAIGHMFPVQSHALASIAGNWTLLQSGYFPFEPQPSQAPFGQYEHALSKLSIADTGAATVCDYDTIENPVCIDEGSLSIGTRTDGGFNVGEGGQTVAQVYAYRNPAGALTVFGTTNPAGTNTPTTQQTHFVATRERTLPLPAVGAVSKYWDLQYARPSNTPTVSGPTPDATTVQSVNTGTSVVDRVRSSDSRPDSVRFNYPIPGVRLRAAGTFNSVPFAESLQFPLPSGATVSINTRDTNTFFYNLSAGRP